MVEALQNLPCGQINAVHNSCISVVHVCKLLDFIFTINISMEVGGVVLIYILLLVCVWVNYSDLTATSLEWFVRVTILE